MRTHTQKKADPRRKRTQTQLRQSAGPHRLSRGGSATTSALDPRLICGQSAIDPRPRPANGCWGDLFFFLSLKRAVPPSPGSWLSTWMDVPLPIYIFFLLAVLRLLFLSLSLFPSFYFTVFFLLFLYIPCKNGCPHCSVAENSTYHHR